MVVVLAPPLTVLAVVLRTVRFEVSEEGLRIRGDLFGRLVAKELLQVDRVQVVDLTKEPDYRPGSLFGKRKGIGIPGYASGWRRLGNRVLALLGVTDVTRVVYLPTRDGYALSLSPADPEQFVTALREL